MHEQAVQTSAGLLVYRRGTSTDVLLGHPGGPFWRGRDLGAWTIPKGAIEADEEPLAAALREFAEETGLRGLRMDTVAGHDALSLLGICPTGLIFVPSIDGIAHNEAEETSKADLDAGLAVLLRAAFRLCRAGGSPDTALRFDCGDPA